MRKKYFSMLGFIWFFVAVLPFSGHTAPQILGLIATAKPLPLSCVDGVCSAEVSGVCLQEHRRAPATGTAYHVAEGAVLTLIVQGRDGSTQTMTVNQLVEIRSLRVFSSLSVSLPERLVRDLSEDVVVASLSVAPLTTLLPVAKADDTKPVSDKEISEYTGPLRHLAEETIERNQANLNAMRILNQMANRLPADTSVGAAGIAKVLGQTMSGRAAAVTSSVARLVTRALNTCREKLRVERTSHLRACLSSEHDILNSNTTLDVWRSLRPGS